ncbi:MAG: hypothetical protein UX38_C0005G0031 [Microgenomates group bacterium GW2011_GWC1_46_16]|nr:MAG: hypothetical protein UX38_C0005G0031 [Microgenomates group bacterium GW2011_GWC1_46_16]
MDRFSAVWLSHSSISAFKHCPRSYYLGSLYRDPQSGHKIGLITPSLALGSAVHEVLESLSILPTSDRFIISLIDRFQSVWQKFSGHKGGFSDAATESRSKEKGEEMLRRVMQHPGPLERKAVKIGQDLPQYWLSEADNLMLCGKLDWLEYLECQTYPVKKASYWHIAKDDMPIEKSLPDLTQSHELVLQIGKEIKLARALNRFKCPQGEQGCKYCLPYEKILDGKATFVGEGNYHTDLYADFTSTLPKSEIL